MKKRITTIAILAASAVLATTGVASAASGAPEVRQDKNIVQVASGAPQFSTLVSLIKKAGLVKTLSGKGPFTVLAPTDAAFTALLTELGITKAQLLADKPLLTKVLTYHVVAGEVPASEVVKLNGKKVKTVEGSKVTITVRDGKVYVNKTAKVTATDIEASNGVIHAINNVLVPQSVLTALSH